MIPVDISAATILSIQNAIAKYCLALDTQDFTLLNDVFTPDVTANYEAVSPQNKEIRGLPSMIEKLTQILKGKATHHALSTQILDFDGDAEGKYECRAVTYFTANTWVLANEKDGYLDHVSVFGRYEDKLVEAGEGLWLIKERVVKTFHPRVRNHTTIA